MPDEKTTRVNCRACRHFVVTWDPVAPFGCRAFGFKSKVLPSQEVYASSGKECQLFEPRDASRPDDAKPKKILA